MLTVVVSWRVTELVLTVVVLVVQDFDFIGVLDQLCLSLFSSYSSDVCRGAALESLHALAEAMHVEASDLVGERLTEPHIALSSLTFFYRTSSSGSVRAPLLNSPDDSHVHRVQGACYC